VNRVLVLTEARENGNCSKDWLTTIWRIKRGKTGVGKEAHMHELRHALLRHEKEPSNLSKVRHGGQSATVAETSAHASAEACPNEARGSK
tara:strand:+ start:540 stop:809 length:270 start_codon:yes stop_codon:yes gene_type:complete